MARDIFLERTKLDAERKEFMRLAMKKFDIEHNKKIKILKDECGKTGHKPRYYDYPFGIKDSLYCSCCGANLPDKR